MKIDFKRLFYAICQSLIYIIVAILVLALAITILVSFRYYPIQTTYVVFSIIFIILVRYEYISMKK
jgi:hypothetical protein